jgi:4-amino-4-deoxy-L-arabinose transferase-like glycosyltransferase
VQQRLLFERALPPLGERADVARNRELHALVVALLLALIGAIMIRSLDLVPYLPASDDGYYVSFMTTVASDGVGAFPDLFQKWNATPADWVFPPPTRIAFIVASAVLSKVLGADIVTLSWLSLLSHLGWTAVNWAFARRRMGESFALALAALCGFSPLLLGLGRLALMDSFACFAATLAIWLFLEALEQPTVVRWRVLFGAALSFAILTKELNVLLAPPLVAMVLLERYVHKAPLSLAAFASPFAVAAFVTGTLFVLAAGGVAPLLTTTELMLSSPKTNEFARLYCAGPWFRYLIDYLSLSPLPTLLGLMAAGSLMYRLRGSAWPRPEVLFLVLAAGVLLEQAPLIKNLRYVTTLDLSLRFLALAWLFRLGKSLGARSKVLCGAGVVIVLCALDWQTFEAFWVSRRGYDPLSLYLLQWRQIIP